MDKSILIVGAMLEVFALTIVVRLWMRRPSKIGSTLFWSVVLLVPFFGVLLYFFLRDTPSSHPDLVRPYNDTDASHHDGGGSGGH